MRKPYECKITKGYRDRLDTLADCLHATEQYLRAANDEMAQIELGQIQKHVRVLQQWLVAKLETSL